MCGASRWTTFRQVTLFLLLPVLTSGVMLSFIRGIESFESPLFFGTPAGIKVISTEIYDSITQRAVPNYQSATALSFVIMGLMLLLVVWQWSVLRGKSFQTVTGKGFNPGVSQARRVALGDVFVLPAVLLRHRRCCRSASSRSARSSSSSASTAGTC